MGVERGGEKKDRDEAFLKMAFCIDGEAKVIPQKEGIELFVRNLKNTDFVKMTDSKVGTYYIACFKNTP